jgi:hypothetical protein
MSVKSLIHNPKACSDCLESQVGRRAILLPVDAHDKLTGLETR